MLESIKPLQTTSHMPTCFVSFLLRLHHILQMCTLNIEATHIVGADQSAAIYEDRIRDRILELAAIRYSFVANK